MKAILNYGILSRHNKVSKETNNRISGKISTDGMVKCLKEALAFLTHSENTSQQDPRAFRVLWTHSSSSDLSSSDISAAASSALSQHCDQPYALEGAFLVNLRSS